MKKILVLLFLLMISSICYCQQFDGVSISGSQSSVVTAFRAKGYVIKRYFENCVSMTGKLAGENIEIYITNTPVSKKVFKIVVYFDTEDTWGELKYSYIKYYQLLSNKYGSPNDKYSFFQDPYYDGDGYEMTAVQLKKCVYAAYWMNMGLSLIHI